MLKKVLYALALCSFVAIAGCGEKPDPTPDKVAVTSVELDDIQNDVVLAGYDLNGRVDLWMDNHPWYN